MIAKRHRGLWLGAAVLVVAAPQVVHAQRISHYRNRQPGWRYIYRSMSPSQRAEILRNEYRLYVPDRLDRTRADAKNLLTVQPRLLPFPRTFESPAGEVLDARNMLKPRSASGVQIARRYQHYDIAAAAETGYLGWLSKQTEEADAAALPLSEPADPQTVGAFGRSLEQSLALRSEAYYRKGTAHFRAYVRDPVRNADSLPKSRQQFVLMRAADPDDVRALTLDVIVSFQIRDYHRAMANLLRAVERVESLDELVLEKKDLFESDVDFNRYYAAVNRFSETDEDVPGRELLMAYCAWLHGDLNLAVQAMEKAEGVSAERPEVLPAVRKLHRFLEEARASSAPPAG